MSLIRITEPVVGIEEEAATLRVIRSGWLSAGAEVRGIEEEFASFVGAKHAIACSSGTAALQLALECSEIASNAPVIVPSFTFVATASAAIRAGNRCIFADVESLCMPSLSVKNCAEGIARGAKAVVFVTYAGYAGTLESIAELTDQKRVPLVIDATHAPGATTSTGADITSLGICSAFSFHSTKNMSAGEGGMLVTNDSSIAAAARLRRSHGLSRFDEADAKGFDYEVVDIAENARMPELTAAVLRAQLLKLPHFNDARRTVAAHYDEQLMRQPVLLPLLAQRSIGVAHLYPVVLPEGTDRRRVRKRMALKGIETSVHYPCLHKQPAFYELADECKLPMSEDLSERVLTLPLHPNIQQAEAAFVVDTLLEALQCTGG